MAQFLFGENVLIYWTHGSDLCAAAPFVVPFGKSKNLVQDDKLAIECSVLGYPIPNITWYKEGELIVVRNFINVTKQTHIK